MISGRGTCGRRRSRYRAAPQSATPEPTTAAIALLVPRDIGVVTHGAAATARTSTAKAALASPCIRAPLPMARSGRGSLIGMAFEIGAACPCDPTTAVSAVTAPGSALCS